MKAPLRQAIDLLRRPDPGSIERALEMLQGTVFSFSMKVCGHREDAEDTSQDVLLRALPHLPKFDSERALAVWLYKVARNRCVSARRRSRFAPSEAKQLSLDELMPDGRELEELVAGKEPTAEASLLAAESEERLRAAVLRLPPPYRLVLVLHDMEGLDNGEVADILGIREGTVRVRLHRARLYLRRELNRPAAKAKSNVASGRRRVPRCRGLFAALSDYLDGIVDDATCDEMQRHISDCAPCQAFVQSLEDTVRRCRAYDAGCPPEQSVSVRKQLVRQYLEAASALSQSRKRTRTGTAKR